MKKRRRNITLIEIMIVMFLIAMIIGVVAYNYQGSLDEGKAFKTKTTIEKAEMVLTMAQAEQPMADVVTHWQDCIRSSPLVQNPSSLFVDGWGLPLQVAEVEGKIVVSSERYKQYQQTHPGSFFKDDEAN